jgi:hypothetical protein
LAVSRPTSREINSARLNRVLTVVFDADITAARFMHPPFGVSALVIARSS